MNSGFARCRSRPGMTNKRASLPVFFERRRVRRIPILTAALEKYRGRAGRQGPDGPADLDASRHRGLSKSDSAASPPFPWRPARGVLRFAPPRPRWTSRFRRPAFPLELEGPPIHLSLIHISEPTRQAETSYAVF